MQIERLDVFTFDTPFNTVFRHASASRWRAQNVIVAARGPDGATGWGEGCPRSYVSGETVESASNFIHSQRDAMTRDVSDIASLRSWIGEHRALIDANPAAFCAIETAIVDLIGKAEGRTAEQLLDAEEPAGEFQYSAVLGDSPWPVYRRQCRRYQAQGFRDFKVKVSGRPRRDRHKMRILDGAGAADTRGVRVRIDANNLWISAAECASHLAALGRDIYAVEEPLQADDLDGFRRVADAAGTRIVLDESLLRIEQLDDIGDDPQRWIANIRVSKMGGVLRSLAVTRRAADLGIAVIVGCQVGETSILARAGLTVMQAARPSLVAAEGAFGTHLLRRDLASPGVVFGPGGTLAADSAGWGPEGYGLEVDDGSTPDLRPLGP
ncbi:MAG: hypothetical protein OXC00_12700 [Acidimicrobiaceae bacterium]|nr:hypothetical protein [Acidimicrobiaceae bacterium]